MTHLLQRNAAPRVRELLDTFRLVMLGGARQTGKTTLAADLLGLPASSWFNFDEDAVLTRALKDPTGFVQTLPKPAAVDEFQRAGQGFLLAVKQAADRDRSRGQLLLTGSTNYLAARGVSETLAGRVGRLSMWPLSAGERRGVRETFVDSLFIPDAWPYRSEPMSRAELSEWILEGGFPEVVAERLSARTRRNWFETYVYDVVSREALRPVAEIRFEGDLRKLLRLVAARMGTELVLSNLADDAEMSRPTAANYLGLLEALHLVTMLPAWSTNLTKRAARRPKAVLVDTGLAAELCGIGERDFGPAASGTSAGALFENLVITEILKQTAWNDRFVDLSHLRDRNGTEIDLIVEDRQTGEIAAIEIKLTSTPLIKHARHLEWLRDRLGPRFVTGLVLHAGSQTLPFGDRIWAVPVSTLWRSDH